MPNQYDPAPNVRRSPTPPESDPITVPDSREEQVPVLYTPNDAAELLRVPESWLRRKAAARQVPCTLLGRHLRFSAADLDSIVTDHAQPAGARQGQRRRRR